jgi:hypothetical protein
MTTTTVPMLLYVQVPRAAVFGMEKREKTHGQGEGDGQTCRLAGLMGGREKAHRERGNKNTSRSMGFLAATFSSYNIQPFLGPVLLLSLSFYYNIFIFGLTKTSEAARPSPACLLSLFPMARLKQKSVLSSAKKKTQKRRSSLVLSLSLSCHSEAGLCCGL